MTIKFYPELHLLRNELQRLDREYFRQIVIRSPWETFLAWVLKNP